ncbi:MAG: hypothetical protein QOC68_2421 [Solirubrobacteraceae bacterium]|jgi:hypothetical protein|nr:hypothetical protein [Solirubrobacteraceae bacterium]
MSATTVPTERPSVLELARDDGPIAAAIGAAAGGAWRVPAIAPLLAACLPAVIAIVATGDAAPRGVVVGAIAWAVLVGGLASARPLTDPLRWAVPPTLRAIEYGGLLWIAAVAGSSSLPAAFALLCALAYHHYDVVYGLRHRGVALPSRVRVAGGGWDGRLLVACVLLLAGALPAGFFVMAAAIALLFVGETIVEWRRIGRAQPPVYDDEEDEAE